MTVTRKRKGGNKW